MRKRIRKKPFSLPYELFYENKQHHIVIEGEEEEKVFSGKTKQEVYGLFTSWFHSVIQKDEILSHLQKGYDIEIDYPPILEDVRTKGVGFHITDEENGESIQKKGLIARGNPSEEVDLASIELDKYKPDWIPSWVKRYESVYFSPSFENYYLYSGFGQRTNCHLYATVLKNEKAWVGSEGVGGFCLFSNMDREGFFEYQKERIEEEFSKDYWNYSCSLETFLKNGKRVKKKDSMFGLDEILVPRTIPKEEVIYMGRWDDNGTFIPSEHFVQFVREERKKDYLSILEKYDMYRVIEN